MKFAVQEIAGMTDLSAVRADGDEIEIRALADAARKYRCLCVSTLPWQTPLIKDLLADEPEILVDGVVSLKGKQSVRASKAVKDRIGIVCFAGGFGSLILGLVGEMVLWLASLS